MGLDISIYRLKRFTCPNCGKVVGEITVGEEHMLGGNYLKLVLPLIGYTDEDYCKYKTLEHDQTVTLRNLIKEYREKTPNFIPVENRKNEVHFLSDALCDGDLISFEADW